MMKKLKHNDEALVAARLNGILPRIDIAGYPFIVDWRLKELRPVDDFSTRLDLRHMPMSDDGEKYLCFYHVPTRCEWKANDSITAVPKDVVLLEIPYELKLDPVSVARQYGLKDTELLENHPIQKELKAKVIPLEETGLPDLIKQNREKLKYPVRSKTQKQKGKGL